jgi:hypothetical protein
MPAVPQLMEAWAGIVGPAIAAVTVPRHLARGTLTIGCSGPVATELQHLSPQLIDRINRYIGSQPVRRLRFVQTLASRRVALPHPKISGAASERAARAVSDLPEGPLRSALLALGRAVLNKSASRLGK